jgi:hypothetical protein
VSLADAAQVAPLDTRRIPRYFLGDPDAGIVGAAVEAIFNEAQVARVMLAVVRLPPQELAAVLIDFASLE